MTSPSADEASPDTAPSSIGANSILAPRTRISFANPPAVQLTPMAGPTSSPPPDDQFLHHLSDQRIPRHSPLPKDTHPNPRDTHQKHPTQCQLSPTPIVPHTIRAKDTHLRQSYTMSDFCHGAIPQVARGCADHAAGTRRPRYPWAREIDQRCVSWSPSRRA